MTRRLLNCQRLLGMVVTMLCLLGIAAYSTMPRQEDPSFPYRAGLISINYPGASAEAVERLVLRPLVDELRQVEEVDYTQSTARTGVAIVRLRLNDDIYDTDPNLKAYVDRKYGGVEEARMTILQDFFKHGFDGSGDDGGSCIDGRLTSAWNWCSLIAKKPYYSIFLLTGFKSFDGDWGAN